MWETVGILFTTFIFKEKVDDLILKWQTGEVEPYLPSIAS